MLSNMAVPIEYGRFRAMVLAGLEPVNEWVSMEMNRIDRLIESREYYYDDEAVEKFVGFCETEMTLTNGDPVIMLPSFRLWAESLLSWYHYVDETFYNQRSQRFERRRVLRRLVNVQYLIVARGAAKSMYAAFIHAYFLYMDTSTTQQIVTAPTKEQAEETLEPIRTAITVARGPYLKFMTMGNKLSTNIVNKQKTASTKKGIENFMTNSIVKIRPMRIDKLQGLRCKVSTVDEWLSGVIREDPIGALEQGATKGEVDDYVILATSSEGTVRDGVGDSIKMNLIKILRGDYEDLHTSIWYYRLDDVSEVAHPDMWRKANPNLGATVSYETYWRDVKLAENDLTKRPDILAKRFGIPVEGYTYFFAYEETLVHPKQNFDGLTCAMGADLSQGDDFCAFTFLFPLGGDFYGVKTRSYVSENKVRKLPEAMRIRYEDFVNEGTLVIMPGGVLSMPLVYDDLDAYICQHHFDIDAFGYDPYNADYFVNRWCSENGEYGVTKVIQGSRTESVPMGEVKNLAINRTLIFDEELMKFAMGNAVAIIDNNGNYKLSKKRADEKIDNVAALLDAWIAYRRNQEGYNEHLG